jgi:hypothetical protein
LKKDSVFSNYFDLLFKPLSCKNIILKSEVWYHFQKMNRKGLEKMTQKTPFTALAWMLVILFLLSACAGRKLEVESIPKSGHPQELINKLEKDIALARNERINVLAPTWFAKSESSLNEAKKLLDEGAELAKIFGCCGTG